MLSLDRCLVERIKRGDLEAFDELYRRYLKPIYGYVYRRVNHRGDAEDITQEVFVRAFKHVKDFRGEASLVSWLYLIARNEISRFFRKKARLKRLLKESRIYPEKESSFVEDMERKHSINLLYQAIETLPSREREVLILHGLKEIPFSRISLTLGENKEATKSTYYRSIRNLRKYFKKRGILFEQKTEVYESSSLSISKGAKTGQGPLPR